jgi:hypothetical protein
MPQQQQGHAFEQHYQQVSMVLFWVLSRVESQGDTKVAKKHTVFIFSPEDEDDIFIRNGSINLRVHEASKP